MGETFALADSYVLLGSDGRGTVVAKSGAPPRIAGYTIGLHHVERDSVHDGELHDDGDELLVVLSGSMTAVLYCDRAEADQERITIRAGEGAIVPSGVWHRLLVAEPTVLIHATPGPAFDVRWRPIEGAAARA